MTTSDRVGFSLMMFLNYVIWGEWYVTLDGLVYDDKKSTSWLIKRVSRHGLPSGRIREQASGD
jgi:hypothetical protein